MDGLKQAEKILVVDSDEGGVRLQQQLLERIGYIVLTASSSEEAVTLAKSGVDVVILEYHLGHVTGVEVCEQLRAAGLNLPVIMVTGFSEEATVIKALRSGVRDFVPKTSQYLDYLPQAVDRVLQQKRTEQHLLELEDRRRQSQKMEALGQLAGRVAHEFNNLLQIIQGFTEGAIEDVRDRPDVYDDLREVLAASSKAAALTGQLLTFGRRQSMQMGAVDLKHLITDLMNMLNPLLGQEIETKVHFDPELGHVWGCETMLGQVVMNLCLNARDAMAGGGELTIRCSNATLTQPLDHVTHMLPPGQYVRLQVSDTGTGIAMEHLSHIFEPFFTTKSAGQGTGLGLATVFGVVEEHGGGIEVQSTVGEGTTFGIYLPQVDSVPLPHSSPRSTGSAESTGEEETILIAEDETGVRQYLERVLSRAGYRVLAAGDGEEALDLFRRHQAEIDLLLLDVEMPKLPGADVYQAVQALRPGTKCAFISGCDPESDEFAFEDGRRPQFLRKPFRGQVLLQVVRELLDEAHHSAAPGHLDAGEEGSSRVG